LWFVLVFLCLFVPEFQRHRPGHVGHPSPVAQTPIRSQGALTTYVRIAIPHSSLAVDVVVVVDDDLPSLIFWCSFARCHAIGRVMHGSTLQALWLRLQIARWLLQAIPRRVAIVFSY
jgi:hypothetical protein